ncbi:hypothetical protein SLE2022_203950 [Rubroshorea leprosula]
MIPSPPQHHRRRPLPPASRVVFLSSASHLSLPSKTSAGTLDLSVSHLCVASLNPRAKLPITCLAVHGLLLYAASANEVRVYERKTWTLLDTFNGEDSSSGSVKAVSFCEGKVFTAHQDCKIRVWQLMETKRHKLLATLPTVNDRLRNFILPKNYVSVLRHVKRSGSSTPTPSPDKLLIMV